MHAVATADVGANAGGHAGASPLCGLLLSTGEKSQLSSHAGRQWRRMVPFFSLETLLMCYPIPAGATPSCSALLGVDLPSMAELKLKNVRVADKVSYGYAMYVKEGFAQGVLFYECFNCVFF